MHAWTIAKKGTCTECGWPLLLCETGHFEAQTRVCRPSQAVEAWQEQNKNPGHGVKVSARLITAEDVAATVASAPAWWVEKHMNN